VIQLQHNQTLGQQPSNTLDIPRRTGEVNEELDCVTANKSCRTYPNTLGEKAYGKNWVG